MSNHWILMHTHTHLGLISVSCPIPGKLDHPLLLCVCVWSTRWESNRACPLKQLLTQSGASNGLRCWVGMKTDSLLHNCWPSHREKFHSCIWVTSEAETRLLIKCELTESTLSFFVAFIGLVLPLTLQWKGKNIWLITMMMIRMLMMMIIKVHLHPLIVLPV